MTVEVSTVVGVILKLIAIKGVTPMKKLIYALLCLAIICSLSIPFAFPTHAASTIYVPDDYSTIQAAVDAASPGDTIIVRDGTYTENIDVNKSITIQSENGTDATIVQAASLDNIFEITADHVDIIGFTIQYAVPAGAAIYLMDANYCGIYENTILGNNEGIHLEGSKNNTITANHLVQNWYYGIKLVNSGDNIITNNHFSYTTWWGIDLGSSSGNLIADNVFLQDGLFVAASQNTVTNNTVNGKPLVYLENTSDYTITDAGQVILVNCDNITVENLTLTRTTVGIELWESTNCRVINNKIDWGSVYGIYLGSSSNNFVSNNSPNGYFGIGSGNSIANTVTGNSIIDSAYGIWFEGSNSNIVYLNNLRSTYGNRNDGGANVWQSPSPLIYAYNDKMYTGYLGNYWNDYTGSDSNGDGVGETPHAIGSENDYYPLVQPFENYHEFSYIGKYTATAYAYPEEADPLFGGFKSARVQIVVQKPDSTSVNVSVKKSFLDAMKMNGGGLVNSNPQSYVHLVQWTLTSNIFKEIDTVAGSQKRPLVAHQSIAKCPSDSKLAYGDEGFFVLSSGKTSFEFSIDDTCPACCKKGNGIDFWLGVGKAAYSEALDWGKKTVDLYVYK